MDDWKFIVTSTQQLTQNFPRGFQKKLFDRISQGMSPSEVRSNLGQPLLVFTNKSNLEEWLFTDDGKCSLGRFRLALALDCIFQSKCNQHHSRSPLRLNRTSDRSVPWSLRKFPAARPIPGKKMPSNSRSARRVHAPNPPIR